MNDIGLGVVVIPAFGKTHLTHSVVEQWRKESAVVDLVIVDNGGDVDPLDGVHVLRPGSNLGWLKGTNFGLAYAQSLGAQWFVCLNNDTTLSDQFFAGLRTAVQQYPEDLLAPCYNDVVRSQSSYFRGIASEFFAEARELRAGLIDGTCFAFSKQVLDRVGFLDAEHFGGMGWGGMEDYILRVRASGGTCQVTRRSYLEHATGSTAHSVMTQYERYAYSEMRIGMSAKWGRHWRANFSDLKGPLDSNRQMLADRLRRIERLVGLSNARFFGRGRG